MSSYMDGIKSISIHAPSRERRCSQCGSEVQNYISIHAPSRERLDDIKPYIDTVEFQSTLPRGSDHSTRFRPSLAGISIHAPSRERPIRFLTTCWMLSNFNPRSLAGATSTRLRRKNLRHYFNPRSLAGATSGSANCG